MSEKPDHYFSARPASADERRTITVRLAGRELDVETAGGIFSPGRLDLGTQVLLRSVPDLPERPEPSEPSDVSDLSEPAGEAIDVLDLGCGWGPVAMTAALGRPDARVWAVDVNERSLDLVARNAHRLGLTGIFASTPDGVPDGVLFDAIWSNPPIRVGKPALHAMLEHWIPRLRQGACAYLVVQRNLGADSLQTWLAGRFPDDTVTRLASAKGFRVLQVRRG